MSDLKISVIIVDDEKKGIDALQWKLSELDIELEIKNTFTSPEKALIYCISHPTDIIFLDIDMPKINGIDFASKLKSLQISPCVIFVTGHEQYMLDALRNAAFDYLLKPVDIEELERTLRRFQEERHSFTVQKVPTQIERRIAVPTSENIIYLEKKDIRYCASDSNYTEFHLENNKKLIVARTLGKVEQLLDHSFIRIHHSYIVNRDKIISYQRGTGGNVRLRDGTILPVSKNRKDELLEKMN